MLEIPDPKLSEMEDSFGIGRAWTMTVRTMWFRVPGCRRWNRREIPEPIVPGSVGFPYFGRPFFLELCFARSVSLVADASLRGAERRKFRRVTSVPCPLPAGEKDRKPSVPVFPSSASGFLLSGTGFLRSGPGRLPPKK